jgi:glyoxylase-like metal-dependent hydrolase (beta-lactamase superfamily II)
LHGDPQPLDDSALGTFGVHRLEVPVPFLEAGGPANAYAIEDADGRWTLFDTGIGTPEGRAALFEQAARLGVALERLSRIVVSHGHVDHFGNAQELSELSGARVFVHPADVEKVVGNARFAVLLERHRGFFLRLGVPEALLEAARTQPSRAGPTLRYVDRARLGLLADGEVLRFKHFDAVVRHLPGHTPGLVCLHAEGPRLFFADDHVLAKVSPNPLIDLSQGEGPEKFRALSRYLEGARWVREQPLDVVLPGHGPAFRGHEALLDGLFSFYLARQEKLRARLVEAPATVFDLLPVLFPRRDVGRLVLMLSEVLANLEVLEDRGLVRRADAGAVVLFHAVA